MRSAKRLVSTLGELRNMLPYILCSHTKNTSDSFVPWELISDRNYFYGTVFAVPCEDWKPTKSINSIAILCDYLTTRKFEEYDTHTNKYKTNNINDTVYTPINTKEKLIHTSFIDEIKKAYPNIKIYEDIRYTSRMTLQDVLVYLETNVDNLPEYIIFNGVEATFERTNGAYQTKDSIDTLLNKIISICNLNDVKPLCILTPTKQLLNMNMSMLSNYYLTIDNYNSEKLSMFNLLDWLKRYAVVQKATLSNINNSKYTKKNTLSYSGASQDTNLITDVGYSQVVYNNIKRFIIHTFLDMVRKEYFIGFVSYVIDENAYKNSVQYSKSTEEAYTFGRKYTYDNGVNALANDIGLYDRVNDVPVYMHFMTKYGTDNNWNLFSNNGEILQAYIFTNYNMNMYLPQQLQVNCTEEYQKQRESSEIDINNLIKIRKYCTGAITQERGTIEPPVFPGTGCPWLYFSEQDMSRYCLDINNGTATFGIFAYITRNNFGCSISLNFKSIYDYPDIFQTISVGMLDMETTQNYEFPLFACGGTQALKQDHYQYTPIGGGCPTYLFGNTYDLSIDNIALSNSNPLHVTKFNGSVTSPFKVLAPDGLWKNIFVHKQDGYVEALPTCGGCAPEFASMLLEPTIVYNNGDTIYPKCSDCRRTTYINRKYGEIEPYKTKPTTHSTKLERIIILLNNGNYIWGSIPFQFASYDDELPCGEIIINGERYLSIPNGWEKRKWYYKPHYGIINDWWENDTILKDFNDFEVPKRYKTINDRLLIKLGDDEAV